MSPTSNVLAYNVRPSSLYRKFGLAENLTLHIFWTVLFGLIASLWVIQGIRAGFGMARLPWLSDAPPLPPGDAPLVSVIFAARDEAEKLPGALETLLAQDYPRFEVVAVKDRFPTRETESESHRYCRFAAWLAWKTARAGCRIRSIAGRVAGLYGRGCAFCA
jgi:cellulose synthase/poly-beta-1,6-N-acetylglucosamine synthase-like glycosyltransferase